MASTKSWLICKLWLKFIQAFKSLFMKNIFTLLLLVISIQLFGQANQESKRAQLIELNKFWKQFTVNDAQLNKPYQYENEVEKIKSHLSYVENTLRINTPEHLSAAQRSNRLACLDILKQYQERGLFPKNTFHPNQRVPYFIDIYNTPCAVGHLIIETGYKNVALQIQKENNYGYLMDLAKQYDELGVWAKHYGFSLEELAWIQPTYSYCYATLSDTTYIVPDSSCNLGGGLFGNGAFYIDSNQFAGLSNILNVQFSGGPFSQCNNFSLPAGTYTVMVTDACYNTTSTFITIPEYIRNVSYTINNNSCTATNGVITIDSIPGLVAPYSILTSNGQTASASSLPYNLTVPNQTGIAVTITDTNGCPAQIDFLVANNAIDSVIATIITPAKCYNDSATIQLQIWQGGVAQNKIYERPIGTHYISDILTGGCFFTKKVIVDYTNKIEIDFTEIKQLSCANDTGIVLVSASGGLAPYTGTGNYTYTTQKYNLFTVTDSDGCTAQKYYWLDSVYPTVTSITTLNAVSCANPLAQIQVNWGIEKACFADTITPINLDSVIYQLGTGFHAFTILDSITGCTVNSSVYIPPSTFTATANVTQTNCANQVNFSFNGNCGPVNQPTVAYYSTAGWHTKNFTDSLGGTCTVNFYVPNNYNALAPSVSINTPPTCTNNFAVLNISNSTGVAPYTGIGLDTIYASGIYTFQVSDAAGCVGSTFINVNFAAPSLQPFAFVATQTPCSNGFAVLNVSNPVGIAPFTNVGPDTVYTSGNYTFTSTDAAGCTGSTTITVSFPTPVVATNPVVVHPGCNGSVGNIYVSATGGAPPYTTITNSTQYAGTYTMVVQDAYNCTATTIAILTQPAAIGNNFSLSYNTQGAILSGNLTGGTAPFTMQLLQLINGTYQPILNNISLPVNNLAAGTYQVKVLDANGCYYTYTFTAIPTSVSSTNDFAASIHPNLFSNELVIKHINSAAFGASLQMYNGIGALVYEQKINSSEIWINTSQWPSGFYFVRVGNNTLKLVKE
jgi:hypothetical protein